MHARYLKAVATSEQLPAPVACEFGFVGRSNCGKSSLINGLLNTKLARTSAMPGRTQMLHYFELQVNPETCFFLVDLPGYGFNKTPKKTQKTWDLLIKDFLERANVREVFFLHDIRRPLDDVDLCLLEDLLEIKKVSLVLTKIDKFSVQQQKQYVASIQTTIGPLFSDLTLHTVSNLHKTGIAELRTYMQQQVHHEE
jgi:GTP-binding protein